MSQRAAEFIELVSRSPVLILIWCLLRKAGHMKPLWNCIASFRGTGVIMCNKGENGGGAVK